MWFKWLLNNRRIDRAIAEGKLISVADAILILKKAISIHDYMIEATWDDPALSGDDDLHKTWIFWYKEIIKILNGKEATMTRLEAIEKLESDAQIHQWWIDYLTQNPKYKPGYLGNIDHHLKWRDRWLVITKLLRG